LVETRTSGRDPGSPQQVRYQFGNHLGSAVLELDDQSGIISYEEYFPFGSTSYQAVANQTDVAKRYRYTGKERDTESDLYYHGARYYAAWLGRWTACDPAGLSDGLNIYAYTRNNPIRLTDPTGTQSNDKPAKTLEIDWEKGTEYLKPPPAAKPPDDKNAEQKDQFVGYIGSTELPEQDPKLIPPPKYAPVTITDLGTIQSAEGTARKPGIQAEGVAKLQLTLPVTLTALGSVRFGIASLSPDYRLDAGFTMGASVTAKGDTGLFAGPRLHLGPEQAPDSWDKSGFGGYASLLTVPSNQGQTGAGQLVGVYSRKFGDNVEASFNVDLTLSGKGQIGGRDVTWPLNAGGVAGVQIGLPGNFGIQPEIGVFGNAPLSSGKGSASVLYGVGLARTDDKAARQWGFSLEGTTEIGTGTTVQLMFGYGHAKDLTPPPDHVGY
jgi:RHS repeat-associated protein